MDKKMFIILLTVAGVFLAQGLNRILVSIQQSINGSVVPVMTQELWVQTFTSWGMDALVLGLPTGVILYFWIRRKRSLT